MIIAFGVLRPMLRNLTKQGKNTLENTQAQLTNQQAEQLSLRNMGPADRKKLMDRASSIAKEDPKRVAQVLNSWVASDE
jgi:flagellar biosynthesis/type III secretory pathway M-ring protein FliF/YscJ